MAINPVRLGVFTRQVKGNQFQEGFPGGHNWYNLAPLEISGVKQVCDAQPNIPQGCLKFNPARGNIQADNVHD